ATRPLQVPRAPVDAPISPGGEPPGRGPPLPSSRRPRPALHRDPAGGPLPALGPVGPAPHRQRGPLGERHPGGAPPGAGHPGRHVGARPPRRDAPPALRRAPARPALDDALPTGPAPRDSNSAREPGLSRKRLPRGASGAGPWHA